MKKINFVFLAFFSLFLFSCSVSRTDSVVSIQFPEDFSSHLENCRAANQTGNYELELKVSGDVEYNKSYKFSTVNEINGKSFEFEADPGDEITIKIRIFSNDDELLYKGSSEWTVVEGDNFVNLKLTRPGTNGTDSGTTGGSSTGSSAGSTGGTSDGGSTGGTTTGGTTDGGNTGGTTSYANTMSAVYVSSSGDDTKDGSSSSPVKTLSQAVTNLSSDGGTIYIVDDVSLGSSFTLKKTVTVVPADTVSDNVSISFPTSNYITVGSAGNLTVKGNSNNGTVTLSPDTGATHSNIISLLYSGSVLNLETGCIISGFNTTNSIVQNSSGTLNFNGAIITGCTVTGSGIIYSSGGSTKMNYGSLTLNTVTSSVADSSSSYGSVLYVSSSSTVTLGQSSDTSKTMTISNNTLTEHRGAAVYAGNNLTINSHVSITGNASSYSGGTGTGTGGIYVFGGKNVTFSGSSISITGNTFNDSSSNAYLAASSSLTITFNGTTYSKATSITDAISK